MEPTVRLTREQLYDLVWSKPMTSIATEFGVSSVAFAKYCTKLDVPRPPRGYWQQLASGLDPEREPLPPPGQGTPRSIDLTHYEKTAKIPRPVVTVHEVVVSEELAKLHPIVRLLKQGLRELTHYGPGLRAIRGIGHAVLKVGKDTEPRALRILDALFKAMATRGHEIRFGERHAGAREYTLEAVIGGRNVEFWLVERLNQTDHVETAKEKEDKARYNWSHAPRFDQSPSGELTLEAKAPWNAGFRHRWRDSDKQLIEQRLGEVVLGLEAAAEAWVAQDEHIEQQRRAVAKAAHERKLEGLRAAHTEALAKDLIAMANAAEQAETVRRFLQRLEATVPSGQRSDEFTTWLRWAGDHAARLDPLSKPETVAKRMAPDLSNVEPDWQDTRDR